MFLWCDSSGKTIPQGKHKWKYAYEAHITYNNYYFILKTPVRHGKVYDRTVSDEVYDRVTKAFLGTEVIVANAIYKPFIFVRTYLVTDGFSLHPAYNHKRIQIITGVVQRTLHHSP